MMTFICAWIPYSEVVRTYNEWQDLQNLYESNQMVTATVTNKSITVSGKVSDSYYISYSYQADFFGTPRTFNQKERVNPAYSYYNRIKPPVEIKIRYATRKPSVSRIAELFSKGTVDIAWRNYLIGLFSLLVGIVITVGPTIYYLYNILLTLQLNRHGKIIMGVITATEHRTWSTGKDTRHSRVVHYRYLDYETCFEASEPGFSKVREGQAIEVCYLPNRPHISRPHPLDKYCGWLQ